MSILDSRFTTTAPIDGSRLKVIQSSPLFVVTDTLHRILF